jgi:hypothetical protein
MSSTIRVTLANMPAFPFASLKRKVDTNLDSVVHERASPPTQQD